MVIRVCVDCFNLVGFVLLDQNKAWMICKRSMTPGSIKEAAQELPVIIMNRLGKGMFTNTRLDRTWPAPSGYLRNSSERTTLFSAVVLFPV
jgi:hypothetical protein